MKKILLLIISAILFMPTISSAGVAPPELPDSLKNKARVWVSARTRANTDNVICYHYRYEDGGTVVDGKVCKIIKVKVSGSWEEYIFGGYLIDWNYYENALYEENNRYYLKYDFRSKDSYFNLMADFNLKPGDNVGEYYKVKSVDFVKVNGVSRKRISFTDVNGDNIQGYWVESVGKSNVLIDYIQIPIAIDGSNVQFCAYYEKGKCVFTYDDFFQSTVLGIDSIVDDTCNENTGKIYDLMGREVKEMIPGSIYVRNGKKILHR